MKALLLILLTACSCLAQAGLRSPAVVASLRQPATGAAPAAPSGLNVTGVGVDGATLAWTDNSSTETAFRVQYSYNNGAFADVEVEICSSEANPTAANVTSYFAGCSGTPGFGTPASEFSFLRYKVRAENAFGNSAYSAIVQVPPSVAVIDLAGVQNGLNVDLSWTDTGENETAVRVYRSTNSGMTYDAIASIAANSSTHTDVGIAEFYAMSVLRYYIIIANSGGDGPQSNTATPVP